MKVKIPGVIKQHTKKVKVGVKTMILDLTICLRDVIGTWQQRCMTSQEEAALASL